MNHYFTADWHLGHTNCLKYDRRPFKDVDEMAYVFRDNINKRVKQEDHLHILGDVAMGPPEKLAHFLDQLVCKNLHVVWGNHDKTAQRLAVKEPSRFISCGNMVELNINGQCLTLCHYAMRVWNKSHYGAWQLYGHSHGNLEESPWLLSTDVGVDANGYKPLSMADIARKLANRKFKPVDHHGAKDEPQLELFK